MRKLIILLPFVALMSAGITAQAALIDNGNLTVTDSRTGLIWQQSDAGAMTWGAALSYCEGLSLGKSSSWRLPNIKELGSLVDLTRHAPAIDTFKFPNTHGADHWSSTSSAYSPARAWIVSFYTGQVNVDEKYAGYGDYETHYVVCVRGGLSGADGNVLVTSPNGGQKWKRGTKHTIKWTSTETGGTVTIKLLKGTSVYKTITKKAANTGTYSWLISKSTISPGKYKIKIISNTTPTLFDKSNKVFTIY